MAQYFERVHSSSISNSSGSPTSILTSNSDDALVSIRCVNKGTSAVTVTVIINSSSTDHFVIKDAPIPVGSSLELIDSGSKIVMQNTDVLKTINRISSSIQKFIKQQIQKSEDLIYFIKNNTICRNIQLARYFGEQKGSKCGICDVCISKKKYNSSSLEKDILELISYKEEISQEEIIFTLDSDEKAILIHLRYLLSKDIISLTTTNKYFIS